MRQSSPLLLAFSALLVCAIAAGCSETSSHPAVSPDAAITSEPALATSALPSAPATVVGSEAGDALTDPHAEAAAPDEPAAALESLAAPAAGAAEAPVHERDLGDARVRFWVTRAVRTGRARFEHHFRASLENEGSALLRGTLWVASASDATRVVVGCGPRGA